MKYLSYTSSHSHPSGGNDFRFYEKEADERYNRGLWSEAESIYSTALGLATSDKGIGQQSMHCSRLLQKLSNVYLHKNNLQSALTALNESISLIEVSSEAPKLTQHLLSLLYDKGNILVLCNRNNEALQVYQLSLSILQRHSEFVQDFALQGFIYSRIGKIHQCEDNRELAVEAFEKAVHLKKRGRDKYPEQSIFSDVFTLANLYESINNVHQAISTFLECISLSEKDHSFDIIIPASLLHLQLAKLYMKAENMDPCKQHLKESVKIELLRKESSSPLFNICTLLKALELLSHVYDQCDELEDAIQCIQQIVQLLECEKTIAAPFSSNCAEFWIKLGTLHSKLGKREEASAAFRRARSSEPMKVSYQYKQTGASAA